MSSNITSQNPAKEAAEVAFKKMYSCIDEKKSFIFEAGAGAGKTYSLVEALHYLINKKEKEFLKRGQKIACITYTNVARDQILDRTKGSPIILSETIHSFSWLNIKNFQLKLRERLKTNEKWKERELKEGKIINQEIKYDLGYPKIKEAEVFLHHSDVINLITDFMSSPKFQAILSNKYPFLFIDEYQDTDKNFVSALQSNFFNKRNVIFGFFGDHWQKIYGEGCGKIESDYLENIGKEANFRSERNIVECLNRIRPELPQKVKDINSSGTISIFHTNNWNGARQTSSHWKGDLPLQEQARYFRVVKELLIKKDWDFSNNQTKVLMLTHNILAGNQGYQNLINVFKYKEDYIKKEDPYIAFFVDVLESLIDAFENKQYGKMFAVLDMRTVKIKSHKDKLKWKDNIENLINLRVNGTIGEVISYLMQSKSPRLTDKIEKKEIKFQELKEKDLNALDEGEEKFFNKISKMKAIPYIEMIALAKFIEDKTPFSTKHGVKGDEFNSVLVVLGRGWNQYNFGQFLEWIKNNPPPDKINAFERNRNLFYVVCSRSISNLALLFTQKLSDDAIDTLKEWFGEESICPLPHLS